MLLHWEVDFWSGGQFYLLASDCSTLGVTRFHKWTISTRSTFANKSLLNPDIDYSRSPKWNAKLLAPALPNLSMVPNFSNTKANAAPQVTAILISRRQHHFETYLFIFIVTQLSKSCKSTRLPAHGLLVSQGVPARTFCYKNSISCFPIVVYFICS